MTPNTLIDYQYKGLERNDGQIRLLVLEPSTSLTSPIHCRLTLCDLIEAPDRFEALSYTWEGGLNIIPIFVDGQRRLVTPNLEAFLRHRRGSQDQVVLWVDALCINQEDDQEKNSQVKLMNVIYLAAKSITVWLGRAEDNSDHAMDEILRIGSGSPYEKLHILSRHTLTALDRLLSRGWWYRIWIIQEVFWGGAGTKLGNMRVRCGHKEVWWTTFVIAAARMQSHKDDQRQYFPGIDNILTLENLRYHAADIANVTVDGNLVFNLVSRYRHFHSTNPRDKIFALLGMAVSQDRREFPKIKIDYTTPVREVYKHFAIMALRSNVGLKVLNQCHINSDNSLPTWVPDWSLLSAEVSLPSSKEMRFTLEPWWSRPIPVGSACTSTENKTSTYQYEFPLTSKPVVRDKGQPFVEKFLPGGSTLNPSAKRLEGHGFSKEMAESMQEMMKAGKLIVVAKDDDGEFDELNVSHSNTEKTLTMAELAAEEQEIIQKGERITRRRAQSKIAASVIGATVNFYQAAGDTRCVPILDEVRNTLTVEGFLWDTIDVLQPPFATEVAANWENATHFMVAIGQAKQFVIQDFVGPNPYSTMEDRIEAFWLTLLAGQTSVPGRNGKPICIKHKMRFQEWLPLIPTDWIASKPPVTVTGTGRLESAEIALPLVSPEFLQICGLKNEQELKIELPGLEVNPLTLQPTEWTNEDQTYYTTRFESLAQQWKTQPYDLYQRPFSLPNVVPDPYWETRKSDSRFRNKNNPAKDSSIGIQPFASKHMSVDLLNWHKKKIEDMVPLVMMNTLPPGFEKYALGRSLTVTRKGYLGLVSKNVQQGDRVAVLLGSETPFVLRRRSSGGFSVVGEAYIHGIMDGEVVNAWKNGRVESGKIVLH